MGVWNESEARVRRVTERDIMLKDGEDARMVLIWRLRVVLRFGLSWRPEVYGREVCIGCAMRKAVIVPQRLMYLFLLNSFSYFKFLSSSSKS